MIIKIKNNVNTNFNNLITLEEIIKYNQKNASSNLIELKHSRLKSYLTKKRAIYQRILKVCWAIDLKNKQYYKSNKLKTYSTIEIYNIVNKCLAKDNKKISIRTLEYDISFLNQTLLITTKLKHLGKDNGSFAFYIQNKNLWKHRFIIIQEAINKEIKEYLKDKKIVSDFSKEINNAINNNKIKNIKPKSPITDEPITDEPITDEPITDEPITDEPITDEPITDEPITDEPITDEPITDEPITDEPITDEPITDEPITDEPITDEPITDEPITDEPITDEPITDEPITDEPITDEPITDEPITDEPITDEPITDEPITDEPITDEPITDEPITDEPITDEPITDEPITDEPITDEPITDEPITDEPITDEPITDEPITDEPITDEPIADVSIADVSIADVIPKGIKDINKIKNSIEEKNKKINKISYKEYIANRLVKVHKIEKLQIIKIHKISNNEKTYVNALRNLKLAIEKYKEEYKIEDISNHFIKEFKNKYSKKIWMMNGKTDKTNDFDEIWEKRFKKTFLNKNLKEQYRNNYEKENKGINNNEKRLSILFSSSKGFKRISKIKINQN
ncbi:hypothetical protein BSV1_D13 (plasmid) [Borreliella finlandensis]|uniref:BBD14-like protein n=1 Tax=Borreliella finlandensis TaxID=498741 RepID=A0A806C580_9SPIR|nr:plasmid maintenance protein [Borreliella finlandensis]ACN93381.1 hypothetical protein BSV1_D13 [Borreliella finlandensis]